MEIIWSLLMMANLTYWGDEPQTTSKQGSPIVRWSASPLPTCPSNCVVQK
jgi:hypothetical protein